MVLNCAELKVSVSTWRLCLPVLVQGFSLTLQLVQFLLHHIRDLFPEYHRIAVGVQHWGKVDGVTNNDGQFLNIQAVH